MPKQNFKLGAADPRQVQVEWKGMWKNVAVSLDGQQLGVIPDSAALKAGQTFKLPDGSALEVKLVTGLQAGLRLTHDGAPVPGSAGDPATKLAQARGIVWFIGGLTLVLGVVAEVARVPFLRQIGIGWESAVIGAVFLVLGYFVGKRSMVALALAMVLLVVDMALTLMESSQAGRAPTGALGVRIFFLIMMAQGFKAIREIKAAERAKVG